MSRSRFSKALNDALAPLGFERRKDEWTRIRGEICAMVHRQSSWLGGVTVNVALKDVETEKLFLAIFPDATQFPAENHRMGWFTDGYDRWWETDDPEAPADMARAVITHAVPWFDRPWPLEDQAREWYAMEPALQRPRGAGGFVQIGLVLTLHRMGRFEEASTLVHAPVPRTAIEANVERMAKVRAYLGY